MTPFTGKSELLNNALPLPGYLPIENKRDETEQIRFHEFKPRGMQFDFVHVTIVDGNKYTDLGFWNAGYYFPAIGDVLAVGYTGADSFIYGEVVTINEHTYDNERFKAILLNYQVEEVPEQEVPEP